MSSKNSSPQRLDRDFEEDLKKVARIRLDKGLSKLNPKELSYREITKLLRRTNGYQQSIQELTKSRVVIRGGK